MILPSPIAEELLGRYRYQWNDPDNHRPGRFDIKIVIYHGIALEEVKNRYPINLERKLDYRYVEYEKAVQWLDKYIESFGRQLTETNKEIDVTFYFLKKMYATALKVERTFRVLP